MKNHVAEIAAVLYDPELKPIVAFIEMGYQTRKYTLITPQT